MFLLSFLACPILLLQHEYLDTEIRSCKIEVSIISNSDAGSEVMACGEKKNVNSLSFRAWKNVNSFPCFFPIIDASLSATLGSSTSLLVLETLSSEVEGVWSSKVTFAYVCYCCWTCTGWSWNRAVYESTVFPSSLKTSPKNLHLSSQSLTCFSDL